MSPKIDDKNKTMSNDLESSCSDPPTIYPKFEFSAKQKKMSQVGIRAK